MIWGIFCLFNGFFIGLDIGHFVYVWYNSLVLIDDVMITIKAGRGGDGSAALLRNAKTAKGGPEGGNGGNGGSVYMQGIDDISALRQFQFKKELKAEDGVNGGKQNLYGRNGEALIIFVPVGTVVKDLDTNRLWDIIDTKTKHLLAKGGIGGRGNNEFKSATNQTPRYAEQGTPGETKKLRLKLRLIADVGLIGLPNAGKSSLLEALTNARPKIGDYPFTTLEPNLGVMEGIVLADIPGLIEGASEGKGLGIKFLQHVEKTKLLLHCIDSTSQDVESIYAIVRKELEQYNAHLTEKSEVILFTKSDLLEKKNLEKKLFVFQENHPNSRILVVSIYDEKSLTRLAKELLP